MTIHTLPRGLCLCQVVGHKLVTCVPMFVVIAVPNLGHLCAQDSLQLCPSLIRVVPKSGYFIVLQSLQCKFVHLSAVVMVISRLKSFYICAQVYGYLCALVWCPSCPHMRIHVCPKMQLATSVPKYMVTCVRVCGLSVSWLWLWLWLWLCLCLSVVHCVLKPVAASLTEHTCVYFGHFHNDGSIQT